MIRKKIVAIIMMLVSTLIVSGCQEDTRYYGGNSTIDLPAGKKLVPHTVQWDNNTNIWYLTEDAPTDYKPKTYEFNLTCQKSSAS